MLPEISTLRARIQWLRKDVLGLTTKEMAKLAKSRGVKEVSDGSISRWESPPDARQPPPRVDYVRVLLELVHESGRCEVTADWVLWGEAAEQRMPAPATDTGRADVVSAEPLGNSERLEVLRLLADVQRVVAGKTTQPASALPGRSDREAIQRVDELEKGSEAPQQAPEPPDQRAEAG